MSGAIPTELDELLELVGLLARRGQDARELSEDDKAVVEVAKSIVGLGSSLSLAFGGETGAAVASLLKSLPLDTFALWLVSFRAVAVVVRDGTLAIGEGVPAEVDLKR